MSNIELMKNVEEECRKAEMLLKSGATNLVFGKGSVDAEILFCGEAPGAKEDLQGMPFVGAAGKNLDKLLGKVGLSLNEVYVANVLKYRPPENRAPLDAEIVEHSVWLARQIEVMKPKVVCSLGNYATKLFLSGFNVEGMKEQLGITELHGKAREMEWRGLKFTLIPLFHPAAIIYNQKLLPLWEEDMKVIRGMIGK
ncbi:MAG: uracil-DNA glycosylase [Nanoarchaeota archaeon]